MKSSKIAVVALFCALSIATNYALIGVSNVKLMDFIVFMGGFLFGPITGSSIGIMSWLVYGAINPFGFVPQIWLATMFAESAYGIVGGCLRKGLGSTDLRNQRFRLSVLFAAMGFLPTVLYDIVTNVAYASVFNVPVAFAIFVSGAPFAVLHEVANFAIFGICTIPTVSALGKAMKGWQTWP